jgi:hypothetical protein
MQRKLIQEFMNKLFLLVGLSTSISFNAQMGINTALPNSTLTVNGSFGANYKEITSSSYTLDALDHYVTYNGTSAATFTLPPIGTGNTSFFGRIYKIKNITNFSITLQASNNNTLRIDSTPVTTFSIPPGAYAEVVNNRGISAGTWDLSFTVLPKPGNVEIYGSQVKIPPHNATVSDWTNHTNNAYDSGTGSDVWWVISKSSTPTAYTTTYSNAARMQLVYEYQGTAFNISDLYPMLTTGNSSGFPDVFIASFVGIANVGGKTRIAVSVTRVDQIGTNGANSANWTGTFLINLLLARKVF